MSLTMVWGTVIVILLIFALFAYGAHRADKAIEAKMAAKRMEMVKSGSKAKTN